MKSFSFNSLNPCSIWRQNTYVDQSGALDLRWAAAESSVITHHITLKKHPWLLQNNHSHLYTLQTGRLWLIFCQFIWERSEYQSSLILCHVFLFNVVVHASRNLKLATRWTSVQWWESNCLNILVLHVMVSAPHHQVLDLFPVAWLMLFINTTIIVLCSSFMVNRLMSDVTMTSEKHVCWLSPRCGHRSQCGSTHKWICLPLFEWSFTFNKQIHQRLSVILY